MTIKLAIAQINCCVGDLVANAEKIFSSSQEAYQQGAQLVITPELALTGYPPEDLLLRPAFMHDVQQQLQHLIQKLAQFHDLHVLIGHPVVSEQGALYNAVSLVRNGQCIGTYHKQHLPNYGVFDEKRYFTPGHGLLTFHIQDEVFGVLICEDLWFDSLAQQYKQQGVTTVISLNASPFHLGKPQTRLDIARKHVSQLGMRLVYTNLVGGQDELVFDGASFVLDTQGGVTDQAPMYQALTHICQLSAPALTQIVPVDNDQQLYQALVMSLRDYVTKNRFSSVLLGLSGGVDSALVLAIAYDALGADRIQTVMMPSAYTASISTEDAHIMATSLGVTHHVHSILPTVDAILATLADTFKGLPQDTTEENIQARARGLLLMALSNKFGALVLPTGNKSEMATGYCTLYGDMVGGFALLKDLTKTRVYALCRWRNQQSPIIPERIIIRPPSAELRPDQVDQDSLPDYDTLDQIIEAYMENNVSVETLIEQGFKPEDVEQVTRLIRLTEYKRRQAAIGPKLTTRAFGRDWRYPITNRYIKEIV